MAKFPDGPAFGTPAAASTEDIEAPYDTAAQDAGDAGALELARANAEYLVRTRALRDSLAAEADPDRLQEAYEPLFQQAHQGSAARISDPRQRNLWVQSRAADLRGHILAVSDRAVGLTREREVAGVAAQLDALREAALQADDTATRAQFIDAAHNLVASLDAGGFIPEDDAKARREAWAQDFAVAAFSKLPMAEQTERLRAKITDDSRTDDLVDLVPKDLRESLLEAAQANVREEEQRAAATAALDRHKIESDIRDDLAAIGKDGRGTDNLSFETVEAALGTDAARKWKEGREDEQVVWRNASDLYALTSQQTEDRLRSLAPGENELGDARRVRVYHAVQERADRIAELRRTDPAKSVEDDPIVRALQESRAQSSDPQSVRDLYAARLAAQNRAGIPRDAQSPITKDEALGRMARLEAARSGQEQEALANIVASFNADFGADAERTFFYALRARAVKAQELLAAARVLRLMRGR